MQPHQNPGVEWRFILSNAITFLILMAEIIDGVWTALNNYGDDHGSLRDMIRATLLQQFGIEHTALLFEAEPCGQRLSGCGDSA